jgi:hypothetical protein
VDPSRRIDFGRGVWLAPLVDGSYAVRSERLPLPWTLPAGRAAGTAVVVDGEPFEITALQRSRGSEVWILRPWPAGDPMRTVVTLDRSWVEEVHRELTSRLRANRARRWTIPLAPVLGSAPASLQQRWESRWGFPAASASLLSSLVELALSCIAIVHILASALGGGGILPPWLEWFALVAPVLAVEAVVRLKHVAALHEPIGSALLLPLTALMHEATPRPQLQAPAVRRHDAETGELELWSPIHRGDWLPGGLLPYRGQPHQLTSVEREGRGWIYTFTRAGSEAPGPGLRLLPPSHRPLASDRGPAPRVLRATVGTALASMGPRDLQEAWGRRLGVPPVLLTVLGAGAECCGSLINLAAANGGASWLLPFDLYFLVEGVTRLALAVGSGRAVGSVPGLMLRPALERLMSH